MNLEQTRLASELDRVVNANRTGHFTLNDGSTVKGATETDVIKHLTSKREYEAGRQYRFPGIAGWGFELRINEAGYKSLQAKNARGQSCNVIVKA